MQVCYARTRGTRRRLFAGIDTVLAKNKNVKSSFDAKNQFFIPVFGSTVHS